MNVCDRCGKPVVAVPPPGSGWIHKSALDAVNCTAPAQDGSK